MKARTSIVLLAGMLLAPALAAAQTPQAGVWQRHDITFNYLPLTTTYSCEGLRQKLHFLLHASGARSGEEVMTYGCAHGSGVPDAFARARLIFYTLRPASGSEGSATTMGVWKQIELSAGPASQDNLHRGDCELMSQFQRNVLAQFSVRHLSKPLNCQPFQLPSGNPGITFEAFVPASAQG